MHEIVDSVKRVTDIMSEITAASEEQTSGIEQINLAVAQMDQVTQQNASLVEEAAAAAESMQEQSRKLAQMVSVFKLDGLQQPAVLMQPHTRMQPRSTVDTKPLSISSAGRPVMTGKNSRIGPPYSYVQERMPACAFFTPGILPCVHAAM